MIIKDLFFKKLIGIALIPISFFVFNACKDDRPDVSILWEREKAVGIFIDPSIVPSETEFSNIEIRLVTDGLRGAMLGEFHGPEFQEEDESIFFAPAVPFTRGSTYEVLFKNEVVATFSVSKPEGQTPELLSIYPTQDTVPENLLKIYLEFSTSMVEGRSLNNITLIRDRRDTMQGTFLELSPELWNGDGTVLTVWLDPGRIKRDLLPNKELGAPLIAGHHYSLRVSGKWKSKDGFELGSPYIKDFVTTARDEESPNPETWNIIVPKVGSTDPLVIEMGESLDYSLLNEVMRIFRPDKSIMIGQFKIGSEERSVTFIPEKPWSKGQHELWVESRLEDLAGNNLNRPFDRDIKQSKPPEERQIVKLTFVIH